MQLCATCKSSFSLPVLNSWQIFLAESFINVWLTTEQLLNAQKLLWYDAIISSLEQVSEENQVLNEFRKELQNRKRRIYNKLKRDFLITFGSSLFLENIPQNTSLYFRFINYFFQVGFFITNSMMVSTFMNRVYCIN